MRRLFGLLCGLAACAAPPTTTGQGSIDTHIAALNDVELPPERAEIEVACDAMCDALTVPSEQACELRRFTGLSHEEQLVSLSSQPSLWPGSLVRGDAAADGQLAPLALERAPLTFSVSLENLTGSPATTMDRPSLSAFREATRTLLGQGLQGSAAAYVSFAIERVHSRSQLKATIKAKANVGDNRLDGAFDFDGHASTTRVLVDFTQAYYTVDIDLSPRPSAYFSPSVTVAQVRAATGDTSPMVVQSVTYGRRILFAVESEQRFSDVQRSLKAALTGWLNGTAELNADDREVLSSATITGLIVGGSAEEAADAVAFDDLDDVVALIERGGAYGADNPGAPISYRLAYLDGRPARLAFATDYVTADCMPTRGAVRGAVQRISRVDAASDEAIYGTVALRVPIDGSPVQACGQGGLLVPVLELDPQLDQFITVPAGIGWAPDSAPSATAEDVTLAGDPLLCIEVELHELGGAAIGSAMQPVRFGDWSGGHVVNVFGPAGRHTEVELDVELH